MQISFFYQIIQCAVDMLAPHDQLSASLFYGSKEASLVLS
jgi:hypothetical protein